MKKMNAMELWRVWFFSRKPVECSLYSDHKTSDDCFLLANSKKNETRIMSGLLFFSLPVILNDMSTMLVGTQQKEPAFLLNWRYMWHRSL